MLELNWLAAVDGVDDPGPGNVTFNAGPWTDVSQIAVSTSDRFGNNIAAWLDGLGEPTNPVKALLRFQNVAAELAWIELEVTGVTVASGTHRTLAVDMRAQGNSFFDLDIVGMQAALSGDQGPTGAPGTDGTNGTNGLDGVTPAPQFLWSDAITPDVGTGQVRFNDADRTLATLMYIDDTDRFGNNRVPFILRFDDADNVDYRSIITFYKVGTESSFFVWKCTGDIVDLGGVYEVPGQFENQAVTVPENGDPVAVELFQPGGKGDKGDQGDPGVDGVDGAPGTPFDPDMLAGESSTALPIQTGPAVFDASTGRVWQSGQRLRVASIDGAKVMEGPVLEYHAETGNLTIGVDLIIGAGTHDEWYISIAGEPGVQGVEGPPGVQGEQGEGLHYDAAGTLAERVAYDDMPQGFAFLQIDVVPFVLFVKESVATADWSSGTPLDSPVSLDDVFPDGALQFEVYLPVLAAATADLGAVPSNFVELGGTANITSFGTAAEGVFRFVRVTGTPTLVYNALTMILPGLANIACLTDDAFLAVSKGGGVWHVIFFQRASAAGAAVELGDVIPIGALSLAGFIDTASALSVDLGAVDSNQVRLTGTTTVGDFGTAAMGVWRQVRLAGAIQINNSASLILPGGANIAGEANDNFLAVSLGSGNWIVPWYSRASGASIAGNASATDVLTGTNASKAATPDAIASLWEKGSDVAAASSMSLGEGGFFVVTGSGVSISQITFATAKNGRRALLYFNNSNTLVHGGGTGLMLPGSADMAVVAGDIVEVFCHGAGTPLYAASMYRRATAGLSAEALASTTEVLTGTEAAKAATPDAIAALWERLDLTLLGTDTDLPITEGGVYRITGNGASITSVSWTPAKAGRKVLCVVLSAFTLVHSSTLYCPGALNLSLGVGDVFELFQYDNTPAARVGSFRRQVSGAGAMVPAGTVSPYAGQTAPVGWVFCYGQNITRAIYPHLFAAIGTTFGAGDGSTTFAVPDLRGRVVAGQDDMGGTSANRLTNAASGGIDGDVFAGVGGAESVVLTLANMDAHEHNYDVPSTASGGASARHDHDTTFTESNNTVATGSADRLRRYAGSGGVAVASGTNSPDHAHTTNPAATNTGTAGSSTAHNNVQPTMILNYIICTG